LSPSSKPNRQSVEDGIKILQAWGLAVELGEHAFDEYGRFLAGRDQDRLGDLNDALRDPGVRAIFTTTGGKGAYRVAHALDFAACRNDPKPDDLALSKRVRPSGSPMVTLASVTVGVMEHGSGVEPKAAVPTSISAMATTRCITPF